MPDYRVPCPCGSAVTTHEGQCGLTLSCPECKAPVKIPNLIALRELGGDQYPTLSRWEKVRAAMEDHSRPFDGKCQACDKSSATIAIPIEVRVMEERILSHNGGIRLTPTGGIRLSVAEGEEHWRDSALPVLLCDLCASRFKGELRMRFWKKWGGALAMLAGLGWFIWSLSHDLLVVGVVGFAVAVGFLRVSMMGIGSRKKINPVVQRWLANIPLVGDAIASEDELIVTHKPALPYQRAA